VRAFVDAILALVVALLPRRRWDAFDLPIQNVVLASSLLTCLGGAAFGITGFFAYTATVLAQREWTAPPMMILVFVSYVIATPRGLLSLYLTISGLLRAIGWLVDEPFGDPILTGIDTLVSRKRASRRERSERVARERLEGTDEPDRRYDGEWAGLTGVDYVVVAARRKPGWAQGTWVITPDGWFTLGEPFDRPTPNGLRTVYPLTLQTTTLDVLRKGVSYELPPLRMSKARRLAETPGPSGES
jgi:hypothetical protein